MASYNKVILAGNLTRDPQLSYTASNTAVCKFGMAMNRRWRDRNSGENRDETCFVDCTAFGRTGETINQYMSKGKPILIDGRLQYSTWEGQDGVRKSKLEVVVENFQFLGGGGGSGGGSGGHQPQRAASSGAAGGPQDYDSGPPPDGDDVPF